ncbi:MAG TPA: Hsp20/alpha crystallin family protein [Flavobacteriales bacterium]|nr:Hsp20/alpha crystallin family protein [Flavobacteriales bacterium]
MGSLMKLNNGVDTSRMFPRFTLFNDFLTGDFFNLPSENTGLRTLPPANIKETERSYEFELAAPGMDRKDFNIMIEGTTLRISGSRQVEQEEKSELYSRKEFSYESFSRTFDLPEGKIDSKNITASYKNGMLCVSVPKTPEAQALKREIKVY